MRSHWVDTAGGKDLDGMGAIFGIRRKEGEPDREFRIRLKTAIISYNGGGTIGAIKMLVRIALALPPGQDIEIVENPVVPMKKSWKVRAGTEFSVNPRSTASSPLDITIAVDTPDAKISDPVLKNVTTGEEIRFGGELKHGDVLKISKGMASLNDRDVSSRICGCIDTLPRRSTQWKYSEAVGANVGTFDSTEFDRSVFAIDIVSSVTFEWTARKPAAFELYVTKQMLSGAGVTRGYVQDIVDSVKACGVRAEVKVK